MEKLLTSPGLATGQTSPQGVSGGAAWRGPKKPKPGRNVLEQKTVTTHIQKGFNFLGHTVRKFGDKLLTKPSKSNAKALLSKVRECIKSSLAVPTEVLIRKLNPMLQGWANYYQHAAAKRTFSKVDNQVYLALWRWAERRHPEKSAKWRRRKYFTVADSDGRFAVRFRKANGMDATLKVYQTVSTRIHRYLKVRGNANPYDPVDAEYFQTRRCFAGRIR